MIRPFGLLGLVAFLVNAVGLYKLSSAIAVVKHLLRLVS